MHEMYRVPSAYYCNARWWFLGSPSEKRAGKWNLAAVTACWSNDRLSDEHREWGSAISSYKLVQVANTIITNFQQHANKTGTRFRVISCRLQYYIRCTCSRTLTWSHMTLRQDIKESAYFQDYYVSEALITSILLTDQKRHFSMLTNLEQKPARLS